MEYEYKNEEDALEYLHKADIYPSVDKKSIAKALEEHNQYLLQTFGTEQTFVLLR